jgi:Tfp pilus assembly protein PilO
MKCVKPERRIIMAGVSMAAVAAIYVFWYRPPELCYAELRAAAARHELTSSDVHRAVEQAVRLRAEKQRKEAILTAWREVLGRDPDSREVLGRVTEVLASLGIAIGRFSPLGLPAETPKPVRRRLHHQLVFEGGFLQTVSFLRCLGRLPFVVRLERLKIETIPGKEPGKLQASINYSVLSRAPSEKEAGR